MEIAMTTCVETWQGWVGICSDKVLKLFGLVDGSEATHDAVHLGLDHGHNLLVRACRVLRGGQRLLELLHLRQYTADLFRLTLLHLDVLLLKELDLTIAYRFLDPVLGLLLHLESARHCVRQFLVGLLDHGLELGLLGVVLALDTLDFGAYRAIFALSVLFELLLSCLGLLELVVELFEVAHAALSRLDLIRVFLDLALEKERRRFRIFSLAILAIAHVRQGLDLGFELAVRASALLGMQLGCLGLLPGLIQFQPECIELALGFRYFLLQIANVATRCA